MIRTNICHQIMATRERERERHWKNFEKLKKKSELIKNFQILHVTNYIFVGLLKIEISEKSRFSNTCLNTRWFSYFVRWLYIYVCALQSRCPYINSYLPLILENKNNNEENYLLLIYANLPYLSLTLSFIHDTRRLL